MAKKPRTPPPPRKVQAPQQRAPQKTAQTAEDKRRLYLRVGGAIAVVAAIAVAAVLGVVLSGGGGGKRPSDGAVAKAMQAAGCTFVAKKPVLPPLDPSQPSAFHHGPGGKLWTPTSKIKWSTFPPTGGSHYQLWAVWGFYTEPVSPNMVVHNEEHGGVILWWGPKVSQSEINALDRFYQQSPVGMVGTPIAGLGDKVAVSSWVGDPTRYYRNGYYGNGYLATCPRFDEKAFTLFRDAYRGRGPEGVPLQADQPGSGPGQ